MTITTTTTNDTTNATRSRRSRKTAPVREPVAATPALKASAQQEQLKRALTLVLHAVPTRSTLPVLSNVLLATDGADSLAISATNLELGIVVRIAAVVERAGAITLPAKLLADVVGSLPNDAITLDMDSRTQSVRLGSGRFEANIKGIEADEFPRIPTIDDGLPTATFVPDALRRAIGQVAFAAATDDTRPILSGVRIALKGDVASFAAADSFRLAFRDITLDEPVATAQEVVIPARTLSTLGKTLVGVERDVEMLIAPSGNQVMFRADGLHLVSRAIDGTYPNIGKYQALAPATVLEIDTKELSKAVELAAYFAASSSNVIRLTLTPEADGKGTLTLSANAAEVGDNRSEHDVTIRGTGGRVALNVQFLADGIAAIGTPTVAIYVDSEVEPVVLRGVGGESYAYVAMPMTVK